MATPSEELRLLIAERIPDGGSEADTMFKDQEILDFLAKGHDVPEAAAYWGWLAKMGEYANLVTVNEGNAAREMTELHKQAQRMVDRYSGWVATPSRGRARIGNITRERRV